MQSKVEVIVVMTTPAAHVMKRATSTIPIVMALVADPVGSGLVTSLAHPGGNITGLSMMLADLTAKRLQLFKEAVPGVARVAVLWNPAMPWHPKAIADLKAVAPSLAIELSFVSARSAGACRGCSMGAPRGMRATRLASSSANASKRSSAG